VVAEGKEGKRRGEKKKGREEMQVVKARGPAPRQSSTCPGGGRIRFVDEWVLHYREWEAKSGLGLCLVPKSENFRYCSTFVCL
jgi:hypothetical protein